MVSDDQIKEIAKLTMGQQSNEEWLKYRHGRLTASNFCAILRGIQKKGVPSSLFKTLLGILFYCLQWTYNIAILLLCDLKMLNNHSLLMFSFHRSV